MCTMALKKFLAHNTLDAGNASCALFDITKVLLLQIILYIW